MGGRSILESLSRRDKFYLGGGNRLIWAPQFPVWLDRAGFWDGAHYYNMEIAPVFTYTVLDEDGKEIPLLFKDRDWRPDRLIQKFRTAALITVKETKSLVPDDCLVSEILVKNGSDRDRVLHLILWTVQESFSAGNLRNVTGIEFNEGILSFVVKPADQRSPSYVIYCTLGADRKTVSSDVSTGEGRCAAPDWQATPFSERFAGGVPVEGTVGSDGPPPVKKKGSLDDSIEGLIYMCLHYEIHVSAGETECIVFSFAAAPSSGEARANIVSSFKNGSPAARSRKSWHDYLSGLPRFRCSDRYIEKYYWYRWYGLRLFTLKGGEGNYRYPCICEGPGYFRLPISYSAQCHILETRWMPGAEIAWGSILNFIGNQKRDGSFIGHIYPRRVQPESFYHADWSHAWDLYKIRPDGELLGRIYEGLSRYAEYFDRERDPERSGLYDIFNHYETGQEYMHRYMAVSERADEENWGNVFRLKGVDAATYMYRIKSMLSTAAGELGEAAASARWRGEAAGIRRAVREKMWDPEEEMFFDVDPETMTRTGVKAATCFYPYFTDIAGREHIAGLKRHLFNPGEFWSRYPVPSSSIDDPYFSARGTWKGRRMNCPWNGRVWPMANSHIAEAVARSAVRFDDGELRSKAVEFIRKYIGMLFFDGDPGRPNCFEHYNPLTGEPSTYRGIDDYQHSWIVDLIIKYVCGIRPGDSGVVVDPFPFELDHFTIEGVRVRDARMKVSGKGDSFRVWIDGKLVSKSRIGEAVQIDV